VQLAQSGMLNKEQRMRAVPRLLDFAGDWWLDDQTRSWFPGLRDITARTCLTMPPHGAPG
jgi:hypothetical protein